MRHGSLFSGIGGFDLAAQWMGWENVFQVENDKFCISKLEKNFPNVKRYGDIREFDGSEYRGLIDIITGGFPCQPFSVAGKQQGKDDSRHLWPEMLRVIREIQPTWVVGENVPGIIKLALEDICTSLEGEGYEVQPFIIPSASIGAWDKRERVWIIAYNNNTGNRASRSRINSHREEKVEKQQFSQYECCGYNKINSDTDKFNSDNAGYNSGSISQQQKAEVQHNITSNDNGEGLSKSRHKSRKQEIYEGIGIKHSDSYIVGEGLQRYSRNGLSGRNQEQERSTGQANWSRSWIEVASELCRSNARVPNRMDRIKALGNSVNPYVVYEIFKAIEQCERN